MINVSNSKSGFSPYYVIPIIFSVVLHWGFFAVAEDIEKFKPKTYGSSRVEIKTLPPKPVPEPVIPEPAPKPKPKPHKPVAKPKPNTAAVSKPKKAAKPVFGVTDTSVTNGNSGVSVRVGNTLNKEMEKKFTKPKKVAALAPAPLQRKPAKAIPLYELTETPSFKKKVEPKYPDEVRRDGIEGTVQLEVSISSKGKVYKVKVLKAPNRKLAMAAIRAVKQSVFNPGRIGQKAVPVKLKIPYRFVLSS